MRGKYTQYQKEKLEEWETNLDQEYPTEKEMQKESRSFPVWHEPPVTEVKGMENVFIRKTGQNVAQRLRQPEDYAADFDAKRFDKPEDIKIIRRR